VIAWLTWGVVVIGGLLMLLAGVYAVRRRLFDDWVLLLVALLEVATIIQAGRGLMTMSAIGDPDERVTYAAYLVSLPFVPIGIGFLALKDKTRWSMGALAVAGFAVAVMSLRCQQIWDLYA